MKDMSNKKYTTGEIILWTLVVAALVGFFISSNLILVGFAAGFTFTWLWTNHKKEQ
jgi:hypothetical protein